MRIAVNTRFLLKNQLEGMGWFTFEILKIMVKQHPEDQFFFLFDRLYAAEFVFAPNITPIVIPPPARHPILFYFWYEWAIPHALKQYKIDVFLSPDNFCSIRTKVPTLLVVHDLAYVHFPQFLRLRELLYYRYFMPKFVKRANRIVTVSNFTKQDIVQQFGVSPEKIEVAYNGIRAMFQPIKEEEKIAFQEKYTEGCDYFFYVGAIHPRKNIHRLIEAFNKFKTNTNSTTKLVLAGRFRWQTNEVTLAFEKATHKEDILFLGYIEEEILPKLMAAALGLVYVSHFEGFGVPLLEAMYCEIPIIAANTSSLPEVAGNAALLVNPDDSIAIGEAMERIDKASPLRLALINEGKKQREKFSWQASATTVYKALQAIVK